MSEWLEARRKHIAASDAASILGVGFSTPFQVWLEKTGQSVGKDLGANERVYWGNRHEPVIIQELALRTGRKLLPPDAWRSAMQCDVHLLDHAGQRKALCVSKPFPLFSATPDFAVAAWTRLEGLDEQTEFAGPGCGEAKTAGAEQRSTWDAGVPLKYQVQTQMQMLVTGLQWTCVPVLIGGNDFRIYDVARNEEFCQSVTQRLLDWHREHVVLGVPPAVTEDDDDAIRSIFNKSNGKTIMLPATFAELDRKLERWKAREKRAKSQVKLFSNTMKVAIGENEFATIDGTTVQYSYPLIERREYTVPAGEYRRLDRSELKRAASPDAAARKRK